MDSKWGNLMYLKKFLGFVLTTLLTGLFLNFYLVITEGYDKLFSAFGVLLLGIAPFIILFGLPVSFISDFLTKNLNGKQRFTKSFFIHITFGLLIGLIISFFLESSLLVVVSLIAAFIFWLVDEILRKKINYTK